MKWAAFAGTDWVFDFLFDGTSEEALAHARLFARHDVTRVELIRVQASNR